VNLKESVSQFIEEKIDYYKQWIFDEPIVISKTHNDRIIQLQKIMYKLIIGFVNNYQVYKHLMPVSSEIEAIIDMCSARKYTPGTYRTDFVYDDQKQIKIIEITCRFGLNGTFLSALINKVASEYKKHNLPTLNTNNQYAGMYDHLMDYLEGKKNIYVLVGDDQRNESKIFADIFQRIGFPVSCIHYSEACEHLGAMENAFIVSELGFDEICAIPKNTLKQLAQLAVFNDFRTIFLIHDKRFFSVMGNEAIQKAFLTDNEIELFKTFYIPTYARTEQLNLWEDARSNKDAWIIKHRSLGKSQKVFAGLVTDKQTWAALFDAEDTNDLVLQKWIKQETIYGSIKQEAFNDFVTGTLLFFDDAYYGFGDFRTSSYPVTNKVDHRKAASLVLTEDLTSAQNNFTNYIP
jgi:hypothetical protein